MPLAEVKAHADDQLAEGAKITYLIAAYIKTVEQISTEQARIVGEDFFQKCDAEILDGCDGINLDGDWWLSSLVNKNDRDCRF